MNLAGKEKIVLLGRITRHPVAGNVWLVLQYMIGLQRLGYDPYYIEDHAATPYMFMEGEDDGVATATDFLAEIMKRFNLADRWGYHALHADGHWYGLSEPEVKRLYSSAALIVNLHGGTPPLPEHYQTGRLVYLGTDPVDREVEIHQGIQETIDYLAPHSVFFTWAENYGKADCRVPVSDRFDFKPTRPPVVMDLWQPFSNGAGPAFTTVGNWRQTRREIVYEGEIYRWSKHYEFLKFLDLPARTQQEFELALSHYDEDDRRLLEANGWKVRPALLFSTDLEAYRQYIVKSRGEFTVAKDQNVRLRSGWFSERSATYLASGRPVITQETGFSNILPTGEGLFGFLNIEEAEQAVETINKDYERHSRAAANVAREYFNYDVVLTRMLQEAGL